MSKYTMMIKDLVDDYSFSYEGKKLDEKLEIARPFIFDFDYPVLDDSTKARIEKAILKHYYFRELAFETVGIFKIKLNDRLNLIMPRYNELYKHQDNNLSPYINSFLKEKGDNIAHNEGSTNAENWNTTSETPQGILEDLKAGKYSSVATYTTDDNTNVGNSDSNYRREVESLSGYTYAEAFRNYYDNIISIDEELVNEFSDLFMVLW
jgi:hypothetical protein